MKILEEILSLENKENAFHMQRFFKTQKGEYGEGDVFLGINVPTLRLIAKKHYNDVSFADIEVMLKNVYHEIRFTALVLMVLIYENKNLKKDIVELYLKNINYINNWDLVDVSCPRIIGHYVHENKNAEILYKLADSGHLWSERISVVSQLYSIKKGDFIHIIELGEKFLTHRHDLMHKAVGWMLREVGKVDEKKLFEFLNKHYKIMPRTMLRYSIERLTQEKRAFYMGKILNY